MSIPTRETQRGIHRCLQASRLCWELASRTPSWQRSCATATTGFTYDRKPSDHTFPLSLHDALPISMPPRLQPPHRASRDSKPQAPRHNHFNLSPARRQRLAPKSTRLNYSHLVTSYVDPNTRDTTWNPSVPSGIAVMLGTRVADPILAAVMCDRDNRLYL